jgi:hypothetical protein
MKQLPRRSGECLLEIIMRRHENRSTMMTSNRPLEDWAKLIGDMPAASAILDRFLQHAAIINITGKSYRLRHGGNSGAPGKSDSKGRPTAGGKEGSPPEDTMTEPPVSSGAAVLTDHSAWAEADNSKETCMEWNEWGIVTTLAGFERPALAGFGAPRDRIQSSVIADTKRADQKDHGR